MYADPLRDEPPFRERMILTGSQPVSDGFYGYSARVPANRPADHYTPRAVPAETIGTVPLEAPLITWQK
jgi:starch phosphorylase